MPRIFKLCLLVVLVGIFTGCTSFGIDNIEEAISDNDLAALESYKDNAYVTSYTNTPGYYSYVHRSAMDAAIQQRSLPAVKKLVELGANRNSAYLVRKPGVAEYISYPVSAS